MYDPDTLAVGVLGKPHGLRGEIALRPFNTVGHPRALPPGAALVAQLVRDGQTQVRRLRSCRAAGDHLLLTFEGVDTPEAARELIHAVMRVPRAALPALSPGEFYVEDLIGCAVETLAGVALGAASGVFWNGAHDVLTVTSGAKETLIPVVPQVVVTVDLSSRRISVDWEVDDDDDA